MNWDESYSVKYVVNKIELKLNKFIIENNEIIVFVI